MLSELIDNVYADWDLIKRLIKEKDPLLYERWKAGGYLVDEDVLSMYPCLSQVLEKLEDGKCPCCGESLQDDVCQNVDCG